MQRRMKHSIGNSPPLGIRKTRAFPTRRETLGERKKMNPAKAIGPYPGEIQISENEVHLHAGMAASRVAMPPEHLAERGQIFGSFQRIQIVGTLPQRHSCQLKLFQPFAIAQPNASPVVALDQYERTIEVKSFDRKQVHRSSPQFARAH